MTGVQTCALPICFPVTIAILVIVTSFVESISPVLIIESLLIAIPVPALYILPVESFEGTYDRMGFSAAKTLDEAFCKATLKTQAFNEFSDILATYMNTLGG